MITRERYEKQLIKLKMNISDMGRIVIDSVENLSEIISSNDAKSANRVQDNDPEVREIARRVEDRCIKLIMKQQPVATDLRVISAAIKLVTDLERMSKQALEIADLALETKSKEVVVTKTLEEMAERTHAITVDAVNAYMYNDLDLVQKVVEADDIIDELYESIKKEIIEDVKADTIEAEDAVEILLQAKYLEKIGDHAENIVNWVNYAVTGEQLKNL